MNVRSGSTSTTGSNKKLTVGHDSPDSVVGNGGAGLARGVANRGGGDPDAGDRRLGARAHAGRDRHR